VHRGAGARKRREGQGRGERVKGIGVLYVKEDVLGCSVLMCVEGASVLRKGGTTKRAKGGGKGNKIVAGVCLLCV
jgi:hypothetical protein